VRENASARTESSAASAQVNGQLAQLGCLARQRAARRGRTPGAPESQRSVTRGAHLSRGTGGALPAGATLRASAVAAYLIGAWALLAQLVAGSGFDVGAEVTPASPASVPAELQIVSSVPDDTGPTARLRSRVPIVLTITVDGPAGSADVYCATTSDRAPFDRVHVRPDEVMDAYHRWCPTSRSD
jgi:hypothetical protein